MDLIYWNTKYINLYSCHTNKTKISEQERVDKNCIYITHTDPEIYPGEGEIPPTTLYWGMPFSILQSNCSMNIVFFFFLYFR